MKRKLLCALLTAALITVCFSLPATAVNSSEKFYHAVACASSNEIGINSTSPDIAALDLTTQRIVIDSNSTEQFVLSGKPIMLMAAFTAAINISVKELTVNGGCVIDKENNVLGLAEGMKVNVSDLLAATVLYNDINAVRVLASGVSDNYELFIKNMNYLARSMGMKNTEFTNITGEYDEKQVSTLEDMLTMVYNCCEHSSLVDLTSSEAYYIKTNDIYTKTATLNNPFEMVNSGSSHYDADVYGIGTSTDKNGITTTLVLSKSASEKYIIALRTNDGSYYDNAGKVVDYLSANYELIDISGVIVDLVNKTNVEIGGETVSFNISKTNIKSSSVITNSFYSKSLSVLNDSYTLKAPEKLPEEVSVGSVINGFEVWYKGVFLTSVDLHVKAIGETVEESTSTEFTIYEKSEKTVKRGFFSEHGWVLILGFVMILGAAIILIASKIKKI